MATLVTPSAKSHERVSGRWTRDIQAESKRDWAIYYAKQAFGTPVPWLLMVFLIAIFIGRAAIEIAAWSTALLTAAYVAVDRMARDREFTFFSVGSDLFLLGFFVTAIFGIFNSSNIEDALEGLSTLRWIPLVYLFAYGWQLFPGLNRVFFFLTVAAAAVAAYAISQHFVGMDFLRGETLAFAPLKGQAFYMVSGFYRNPEILGTVLAVLLPLPAAAFMLSEERSKGSVSVLALAIVILSGLAVLWTYKPGIWTAAIAGVMVTIVLQPKRHFHLFAILLAVFAGVVSLMYSPLESFTEQIQATESVRGANQRAQINEQLKIWSENSWLGAGMKAQAVRATESLDGNLYFQILAQAGAIGLVFYLLFVLNFILGVYRIWREIPKTHYWHRVLASGGIGGLAAFHVSGLYWPTLTDSHALGLYAFMLGTLGYLCEQYDRGLVPDDQSL